MKTSAIYLIPLLILSTILNAFGQIDSKIKQVEQNFIPPIQSKGDTPLILQERMAHYKIKGLSIAVIQNYKIAWAKGYGVADDSLKLPVSSQTLFQAGSVSKSLNAVGVLKLVQNKKLNLYTDINDYLKSWKFPYDTLSKGRKITMANLLSHTAGLSVHGFAGYVQGSALPTIPQVLDGSLPANSKPVRSIYVPGLKYEYSGGGVTISQLIVMDLSHQPYAEYMKKAVLQPLGMANSTYAQSPVGASLSLRATGYDGKGRPVPGKYNIYPEQAAAGLWTNPTDVAKYVIETQQALEGKSAKVLNQNTARLMLTPYIDKRAGLGVFIDELDSVKYFQHDGVDNGFRCQYFGSLKDGNGVVVMINADNAEMIQEVVNSVAKVYGLKGLIRTVIKDLVIIPADILESYTGQYQLAPNFILTVTKQGNHLGVQGTGQPMFEVYAEAQNKFYPKDFPADLEFTKDASGKITGGAIIGGGHRQVMKKID